MLSNSARIFKKERKKKYVCGTQWQKKIRGGGHERYFLLKYIRWKVVLSDTKKEGNSCPWTRINRLNYVTISRTAVRLGWGKSSKGHVTIVELEQLVALLNFPFMKHLLFAYKMSHHHDLTNISAECWPCADFDWNNIAAFKMIKCVLIRGISS